MGRSGDKADAALELAPSSLWAALRRAVFRGGQGNRGSGTRDQTVAATQFCILMTFNVEEMRSQIM